MIENVLYQEVLLPRVITWKGVQYNHQNVKDQKLINTKKNGDVDQIFTGNYGAVCACCRLLVGKKKKMGIKAKVDHRQRWCVGC